MMFKKLFLWVPESASYYNEVIPEEGYTLEGASSCYVMMNNQYGEPIDITSQVYHYSQESGLGIIDISSVTGNISIVMDAIPAQPEPEVIETNLEGVLNTQYEDYSRAYQFTAEVKDFYKGATTNNPDGKLTLTDGINDLWVLGSTATSNALYYDGSRYDFNNPQDFQQIALTNNIQIGDSVTMKVYAYHKDPSTTRVRGIILSVIPQEPAVIQTTLDGVLNTQYTDGSRAYEFTATVKDFGNGATINNANGKLTLTDGVNDLAINGSTATSSALT